KDARHGRPPVRAGSGALGNDARDQPPEFDNLEVNAVGEAGVIERDVDCNKECNQRGVEQTAPQLSRRSGRTRDSTNIWANWWDQTPPTRPFCGSVTKFTTPVPGSVLYAGYGLTSSPTRHGRLIPPPRRSQS